MPGVSKRTELVTIRIDKDKLAWAKSRVAARRAKGDKVTVSSYLGGLLDRQLKRDR